MSDPTLLSEILRATFKNEIDLHFSGSLSLLFCEKLLQPHLRQIQGMTSLGGHVCQAARLVANDESSSCASIQEHHGKVGCVA